ncbi:MAG: SWIM zinc finger domain-containing protein [Oscillospiraceae bacterium]
MAFRIGFAAENPEKKPTEAAYAVPQRATAPRKSVVQVYFAGRNMTLAYYNDLFDLHRGDMVYVDGKLEGQRGRVTEVNYNFKIKISDYKRVIAVADTTVNGQFFMAGSHFVTFDRTALPSSKVILWFKAPVKADDEFVSGRDDTTFYLDDLKGMNVSTGVAERGHDYYMENKVRYICIDGARGFAIVEGSEAYEVEFEYRNGEISGLTCSCFCSYNCKHEFAAMLQLRETLELIEKHYADEYERTGYFAAINKGTLFAFAIDGKETGSFSL